MKKKQRKVRLIRAAIQLIFFIAAPSLFSTAFAGVKSIFLAIGGQQSVTWNSFLDITALLLIITILFGRHFCGYACAFGSLGDALYELTAFIRAKCFGKKKIHGYPARSGLTSVTVVCDDGLNADGLSTACFVLGKEKAEELLKKYNADGLFVDDSDHVWMTEGMKERFQLLKDTYSISE